MGRVSATAARKRLDFSSAKWKITRIAIFIQGPIMSDEWFVLFGSRVHGPATAVQLRAWLASGQINADTPVRAGTDGAWTFVREVPDLGPPENTLAEFAVPDKARSTGAVPENAFQSGLRSVVLFRSRLGAAGAKRIRSSRLILGGVIAVAVVGAGVIAGIQLDRNRRARSSDPVSVDSPAIAKSAAAIENAKSLPNPVPMNPAPTDQTASNQTPGPASPEVPPSAKLAPAAESSPAKTLRPVAVEEKPVRADPVAVQVGSADDSLSTAQRPAPRDSFDIPWPSSKGDRTPDELDWEKLDNTIREHNRLYEQWEKQRQKQQEIRNHLTAVAMHLEDLTRRATAVGQTMNQIRSVLGDENSDNAQIFAPPETPHYVQSLAKTYSLRNRDMSRLNTKAAKAVNEFNATLERLDTNLANQRKELARATELRGEWARITKPFALWTRQDRRIPIETSTRWILNNPVFAPAYVSRGIAEIRDKNFGKASEDFGLALIRDPNWPELYALQAVLQDRAGKHVDADRSFKAARRLTKKTPSAFVDVCDGIVCAQRKNYAGAKAKFLTAAKHDPADPAGNAELALLLDKCPKDELRDAAGAVEAAAAACRATEWSNWWCLDVLATAYAASGDFDRAAGCLQRAKQAGPADVQPFLDERLACCKRKQVPTAAVGEL
jgi:tetratricopeptide (TPR) repeat protein